MNKYREFSANFPQPRASAASSPRATAKRAETRSRYPDRAVDTARSRPRAQSDLLPVCVGKRVSSAVHRACTRVPTRAFGIISQTGCNVNNLYRRSGGTETPYTRIYFSVILICALGIFYHRICIRITAGAM